MSTFIPLSIAPAPSLSILDVGHGSCCVVTDGRSTVLVDTGPGAPILEYLLESGIRELDTVVLSHADSDHIEGLTSLLASNEFSVRRVMLNSDASKGSRVWGNLAYEIDQRRRNQTLEFTSQLREGDVVELPGTDVELSIVAPRDRIVITGPGATDADGHRLTSNSLSAVILVRAQGRSYAILTGDIDEVGLFHLVDTAQDLRSDVLVFPHHGGTAGGAPRSSEEFAYQLTKMVQPAVVVFSMGRGRYSNPRPEIIQGVRRAVPAVRIACTQLSERCAIEVPDVGPTHLLPIYSRGRQSRSCCAGTVRVALTAVGDVQPRAEGHSAFIASAAETPLCRQATI